MEAISVSNLRRAFGDREAVKGIHFDVHPGEVFGFLGPNGAGKTTTIKILCTLLKPTAGQAWVGGHDVTQEKDAVRRSIGLVFQDPALDERLTAIENLRFHAWIYNVPHSEIPVRIDRALDLAGLSDRQQDLVKTFSGGMKRRLEIVRSMLHLPRVLFLDEPTIGLDPQTRARIWSFLLELRRTGTTLFLTTHYMDEAEYCDRVAIIDNGEIVAIGTPSWLKAQIGGESIRIRTDDNVQASLGLKEIFGIEALDESGCLSFVVPHGATFIPELLQRLTVPIRQILVREPSLDDVFLKLTGRCIRQEGAESSATMIRRWSQK